MVDAMRSNPKDPVSVAAQIAGHYSRAGLDGDALVEVFNESLAIAERMLAKAPNHRVSMQVVMDKVEIIRTGSKGAKFVPRSQKVNAMWAKNPVEVTRPTNILQSESKAEGAGFITCSDEYYKYVKEISKTLDDRLPGCAQITVTEDGGILAVQTSAVGHTWVHEISPDGNIDHAIYCSDPVAKSMGPCQEKVRQSGSVDPKKLDEVRTRILATK